MMMMDTKTATKPLVVVDEPPSTDRPGQCEDLLLSLLFSTFDLIMIDPTSVSFYLTFEIFLLTFLHKC